MLDRFSVSTMSKQKKKKFDKDKVFDKVQRKLQGKSEKKNVNVLSEEVANYMQSLGKINFLDNRL